MPFPCAPAPVALTLTSLLGKGEAEPEYIRQTTHNPPSPSVLSFAPTGRPTPLSLSSQRRPHRILTKNPANKIRNVYAVSVVHPLLLELISSRDTCCSL